MTGADNLNRVATTCMTYLVLTNLPVQLGWLLVAGCVVGCVWVAWLNAQAMIDAARIEGPSA